MENNIKKNTAASAASAAGSNAPLPLLDICNNLITVMNYSGAVQSTSLPDFIVSQNPALATEFGNWQQTLWQQLFEGLLNVGIVAEAEEMYDLVNDDVDEQGVYQEVISTSTVPTVISLCDDMLNQISLGLTYIPQLEAIANQIQGADMSQIAALNAIISTLNTQFSSMEDQLTDKALDNGHGAGPDRAAGKRRDADQHRCGGRTDPFIRDQFNIAAAGNRLGRA